MAQQDLNVGTPNGQNGDFVRNANIKIQANFTELYNNSVGVVDVAARWTGGLSFYTVANSFPIDDVWYSSTAETLTLDTADATFDRIDLVVGKTDGTVKKITGELSGATPSAPNYDYATEFPIKFILVQAGQTEPPTYEDVTVFNEDAGEPTEWSFVPETNVAVVTGGAQDGTKSVEGTTTIQNEAVFTTSTPVIKNNMSTLSFWVKLKEAFDLKGKIYVEFKNTTTTSEVQPSILEVRANQYGFNTSNTSWQKITIDLSRVSIYVPTVDEIKFKPWKSASGTTGWFIDNIVLQMGVPPSKTPGEVTVPVNTSELNNDGEEGDSKYTQDKDLGAVAKSDDYNDLDNKPSLGAVATSNSYNDLDDKPSIATKTSDITNDGSDGSSTYVENDELGAAATSNSYNDLDDKPALGATEFDDDEFAVQNALDATKKLVFDTGDLPTSTTITLKGTESGDVVTKKWLEENEETPLSSIKEEKITLTPAVMKDLLANPASILPTPGANKVSKMIAITGFLDYNSVAYDFVTNLTFEYATSGIVINTAIFSDFNGVVATPFDIDKSTVSGGNLSSNEAVVMTTTTDATVGDSEIKLVVLYAVQDFNF